MYLRYKYISPLYHSMNKNYSRFMLKFIYKNVFIRYRGFTNWVFVFEYIIFVCCKGLHSRTACSSRNCRSIEGSPSVPKSSAARRIELNGQFVTPQNNADIPTAAPKEEKAQKTAKQFLRMLRR